MPLLKTKEDLVRLLGLPIVRLFANGEGWTWCATENEGGGSFFGLVVSPDCPNGGEWRRFDQSELRSQHAS